MSILHKPTSHQDLSTPPHPEVAALPENPVATDEPTSFTTPESVVATPESVVANPESVVANPEATPHHGMTRRGFLGLLGLGVAVAGGATYAGITLPHHNSNPTANPNPNDQPTDASSSVSESPSSTPELPKAWQNAVAEAQKQNEASQSFDIMSVSEYIASFAIDPSDIKDTDTLIHTSMGRWQRLWNTGGTVRKLDAVTDIFNQAASENHNLLDPKKVEPAFANILMQDYLIPSAEQFMTEKVLALYEVPESLPNIASRHCYMIFLMMANTPEALQPLVPGPENVYMDPTTMTVSKVYYPENTSLKNAKEGTTVEVKYAFEYTSPELDITLTDANADNFAAATDPASSMHTAILTASEKWAVVNGKWMITDRSTVINQA